MSRMAKAPSSTGRLSPSETRAAVTLEEQGTMANTPMASGGRPVSSAASRRARMAASSMGRMVQATWPMSLGKRMRMRRSTVGQEEEIWGVTLDGPPLMLCRSKSEIMSAALATS